MDRRIARLLNGKALGVLDLFAGCGGMTAGFVRAGFRSIGGLEMDPDAARSHALNFHLDSPHRAAHEKARDITHTHPVDLLQELGESEDAVDVLVGGPPCVTFTRVGRAKLRDVARSQNVEEHRRAFRIDPRARLFENYLKFVDALRPLALVMENVPDILNQERENIGARIAEELVGLGYEPRYTLLNAAHFGVPQGRDRFFLIATRADLDVEPWFPQPTHRWDLPSGYLGSRNVALKLLREVQSDLFGARNQHFVPPGEPGPDALPAVTVAQAIGDLPLLVQGRRGRKAMDRPVLYRADQAPSTFATDMRTWPGFASDGTVRAHETRTLSERDHRIFREMKPGDDYPKAHAIASRLFEEALNALGGRETLKGDFIEALQAEYVPPYAIDKFPNKWRKLEADQPARTLMAHLGKDAYTHIHPDSDQARVISVREAARLQSFPDGFEFSGTMNPAFKQVGNAVPPLLAWRLAQAVRASLEQVGEVPLRSTAARR